MQNILGYQVRELFDPVQTHAVYGVPVEQVDTVKQELKQLGATRFRLVTPMIKGMKIICFKSK